MKANKPQDYIINDKVIIYPRKYRSIASLWETLKRAINNELITHPGINIFVEHNRVKFPIFNRTIEKYSGVNFGRYKVNYILTRDTFQSEKVGNWDEIKAIIDKGIKEDKTPYIVILKYDQALKWYKKLIISGSNDPPENRKQKRARSLAYKTPENPD